MSIIKLEIDSRDSRATMAAAAFFNVLNSGEINTPEEQPEAKKEPKKSQPETAATIAAAASSNDLKSEEVNTPEPKKEEPKKEETPEPAISLNDLRQLVAKKAGDHKPTIREWLIRKGYSKTTEVPAAQYGEYVEFLNSLN